VVENRSIPTTISLSLSFCLRYSKQTIRVAKRTQPSNDPPLLGHRLDFGLVKLQSTETVILFSPRGNKRSSFGVMI
jgi:hypothetical protein